jgi:hypothetical protein
MHRKSPGGSTTDAPVRWQSLPFGFLLAQQPGGWHVQCHAMA